MKPKITIITVCLNAEKTIERTIRSVIRQNYENLEYIVIDGGSTDKTLDILKRYNAFISYWISEPDDGIYYAMNKGLNLATGDYINFLNADDCFVGGKTLERVSRFMETSIADILYGNVQYIGPDGSRRWANPYPMDFMYVWMPFNHQTVFMKNGLGRKFDTNFVSAADFKLFYELFFDNRKFQYVPYTIAAFSTGGFSADIYRSTLEVTQITSEGLLKHPEKIGVYAEYIIRTYIGREHYHLFLKGNHDLVCEYIKNNVNGDCIIFCTGDIVTRLWDVICESDCHPLWFVDNDEEKWGHTLYGYEIKPPESLKRIENKTIYILSDKYQEIIREQLENMDLNESVKVRDYVEMRADYLDTYKNYFIEIGKRKMQGFKKLMNFLESVNNS